MSVTLETGIPLVNEVLAELLEYKIEVLGHHIGGSTYITGEGNDIDVIVLSGASITAVHNVLKDVWELCGEESYESQGMFVAYRVGYVNVIIVDDTVYYDNWISARNVCVYLHARGLSDRATRVAIHQIVVDGGLRTGIVKQCLSNLEWVTQSANMLHEEELGLHNGRRKITP